MGHRLTTDYRHQWFGVAPDETDRRHRISRPIAPAVAMNTKPSQSGLDPRNQITPAASAVPSTGGTAT